MARVKLIMSLPVNLAGIGSIEFDGILCPFAKCGLIPRDSNLETIFKFSNYQVAITGM